MCYIGNKYCSLLKILLFPEACCCILKDSIFWYCGCMRNVWNMYNMFYGDIYIDSGIK
jgi:hypothetical protein